MPSTTWVTRDGTEIAIQDMATGHIVNCIAMLERKLDGLRSRLAHASNEIDFNDAAPTSLVYEEARIKRAIHETYYYLTSFREEFQRRKRNLWRSVDDLPKEDMNVYIVLSDGAHRYVATGYFELGDRSVGIPNGFLMSTDEAYLLERDYKITHWMPHHPPDLPE